MKRDKWVTWRIWITWVLQCLSYIVGCLLAVKQIISMYQGPNKSFGGSAAGSEFDFPYFCMIALWLIVISFIGWVIRKKGFLALL